MSRRDQIITLMARLEAHRALLHEMSDEIGEFIDSANEHNSEEVLSEAFDERDLIDDAVNHLEACLSKLDATTRTEE
jgi:hypothetical protein